MASPAITYGTFMPGIPYLRFGSGAKTLVLFAGGPGNLVPKGFGAPGFTRGMRPFTDEYSVYLVTRKCGLPQGYTTRDMSNDYAEMIREEFGGHVDLIVGVSYGGLIAQHFAADHADLFDHIVIAVSAHKITDAAKQIDTRYAELINQHKDREAMAQRAAAAFPTGPMKAVMGAALWAFGKPLLGPIDETFRSDVVIEAHAEVNHEAVESLKRIKVPVLIVGGAEDFAFPIAYMKEMASLIDKATLKLYEGGHMVAFLNKQFVHDVRAFSAQN